MYFIILNATKLFPFPGWLFPWITQVLLVCFHINSFLLNIGLHIGIAKTASITLPPATLQLIHLKMCFYNLSIDRLLLMSIKERFFFVLFVCLGTIPGYVQVLFLALLMDYSWMTLEHGSLQDPRDQTGSAMCKASIQPTSVLL